MPATTDISPVILVARDEGREPWRIFARNYNSDGWGIDEETLRVLQDGRGNDEYQDAVDDVLETAFSIDRDGIRWTLEYSNELGILAVPDGLELDDFMRNNFSESFEDDFDVERINELLAGDDLGGDSNFANTLSQHKKCWRCDAAIGYDGLCLECITGPQGDDDCEFDPAVNKCVNCGIDLENGGLCQDCQDEFDTEI